MMIRSDCLKLLAARRSDEIFVSIFSTAFEWLSISPSDLNYTFIAAMGQTASHGLGLALAFPDRRIMVLDGDGSLLMNLGCLVTNATVAPTNLVHLVFNNHMYELTGGQPTPGANKTDFAGFAKAAGFPTVLKFNELEEFTAALPQLFSAPGPIFAEIDVIPGPDPVPVDWSVIYTEERQKAFIKALLPNQNK
jgi:phosphonopyruvate decarboxylase